MRFLVIISLFVCFIPYSVNAQEVENGFETNFYSTIYLDAFYNQNNSNKESSFDVFQSSGSSNFGLEVSYGKIMGTVELGIDPDEIIRLLFISYQFNDKSRIVFGRDSTTANYTFGQVALDENGLAGYGTLTDDRRLQVKYIYDTFEVALIESATEQSGDLKLPRLEAAYTFSGAGNETKVFLSAGYYKFEDATSSSGVVIEQDPLIAGHIGVGGFQVISDFIINYSLFGAYNSSIYGALGDVRFVQTYHDPLGKTNNILSYGGAIGVGYSIIDMVMIQVGAGYMASISDIDLVGIGNKTDQELGAYINVPIIFNSYFQLIPEVSYVEHITDFLGKYAGSELYAGLHFVATF